MRETTTWRRQFEVARDEHDDRSKVVAVAPSEAVLDVEFDDGYGAYEGKPVLIWTEERVYFPVTYDGSEWIGSAPRNPQPDGQEHVGGS